MRARPHLGRSGRARCREARGCAAETTRARPRVRRRRRAQTAGRKTGARATTGGQSAAPVTIQMAEGPIGAREPRGGVSGACPGLVAPLRRRVASSAAPVPSGWPSPEVAQVSAAVRSPFPAAALSLSGRRPRARAPGAAGVGGSGRLRKQAAPRTSRRRGRAFVPPARGGAGTRGRARPRGSRGGAHAGLPARLRVGLGISSVAAASLQWSDWPTRRLVTVVAGPPAKALVLSVTHIPRLG